MKARIFKPALVALIALAPFYKCLAQQTTTPPIAKADTTIAPMAQAPAMPMKAMKVAPMTAMAGMGPMAPMKGMKIPPMEPMPPMKGMKAMAAPMYYGDEFQSDTGRKKSLANDSAYRKKMNDLNAKMNELRQQMNALRSEEIKTQVAVRTESMQRMMKDRADVDAKNFDRAFAVPRKGFNWDEDKTLQDKIKSGDVKEVTKNYTKSYPAGKGDQLSIDNSFGRVTVNTWDKNEFKVDVEIKAYDNAQADAQKLSDEVSISDSKDGSTVSFKTNFSEKNHSSWLHTDGDKYEIHRVQINYIVYLPSKNSLSITNRFGATTVPDFDGKLTVNNSYGTFTAKKLSNPANDITTKYINTSIETLNGSDLKVDYGTLELGTCDNLNAEIKFSPAKIALLKTSGNINLNYGGGLKIGALDKGFKSLSVNSNYASVTLGLPAEQNLNFDVSVHNGGFNYGDHGVTITEKIPDDSRRGWNPTQMYKGHIGKGDADKTISIKTNYSSVKFD